MRTPTPPIHSAHIHISLYPLPTPLFHRSFSTRSDLISSPHSSRQNLLLYAPTTQTSLPPVHFIRFDRISYSRLSYSHTILAITCPCRLFTPLVHISCSHLLCAGVATPVRRRAFRAVHAPAGMKRRCKVGVLRGGKVEVGVLRRYGEKGEVYRVVRK